MTLPSRVAVRAPAKVNLFLRVFPPDETGYHPVETLLAALDLHDRVEVTRTAEGVALEVLGPDLGPVRENLAWRAARAFLDTFGPETGVHVRLVKEVPAGAGLGGGSSDAAAVLRCMAALFAGPGVPERLPELARGLGTDVAFFLSPSPMAIGRGRGDLLEPVAPLPAAPVLVVVPPEPVSTPWAYRALDRYRERTGSRRTAGGPVLAAAGDWGAVAALAENDFEPAVFEAFPALEHARDALVATGPVLALLSGSGSALFAVYATDARAAAARTALESALPGAALRPARTLERVPPVESLGVDARG